MRTGETRVNNPEGSKLDLLLDRFSKLAGILLPVVIAIVGVAYNLHKDQIDERTQKAQLVQERSQKDWETKQKQYSNLMALIPLLTSKDPLAVTTGIDIYASEAKVDQQPPGLDATIARIANEQPSQAGPAQVALEAVKAQMASECKFNPDGLYIHVATVQDQLEQGRQLEKLLKDANIEVRGVQRVEQLPSQTQLRYYLSDENTAWVNRISGALGKVGLKIIKLQDLSPRYLPPGCKPPKVCELWIGKDTPLSLSAS